MTPPPTIRISLHNYEGEMITIKTFPSKSNPNQSPHVVGYNERTKEFSCTCWGWIRHQHCWHMDECENAGILVPPNTVPEERTCQCQKCGTVFVDLWTLVLRTCSVCSLRRNHEYS